MTNDTPNKNDIVIDAVFTFDEQMYDALSENQKLNLLILIQDHLDKKMLLLFPKPRR